MEMAILEDNVVRIIVLDDEAEESETLMSGSASKLADGFDMSKDKDGESFAVPSPTIDAEIIIPKGCETISVDGTTLEVNDHVSLNGCVASELNIKDNEHSCTIHGISEKHGFIVGDFVWCKIINDLRLPGQVYDSNDASEFALKYRQEGRHLVAFFGDGSCSWCLPSQLLPFLENFVEMSRVCNSRSFLKGVQKAIDEVGRIVESDIICKCIPANQIGALARPMAENGVKAGVLVPEVKVNRLSVPKFEPYRVLAEVHHFAEAPSLSCKLHIAILKSFLSAFYQFKGGYQLPLYDEHVYIEGLEEKKQKFPVDNGFIPFSSDDIINQRKNIKTLAEILGGNVKVEHKSEGSFSVGTKSRKRKVEFFDFHKVIPRKPEEIKVIADEDSTVVQPNQESNNVITLRERTKHKYLSPPSKILIGSIGNSSSCRSVLKCVNNVSEENLPDEKLNPKLHCSLSDVGIQVYELLVKIQFAAVAPHYLRNNGSFDKVSAFVSAVRRSTYTRGSNYKIYRKCITGPKQKKKQFACQRELSPAVRTTPMKMESGKTDDFILDVKFVTRDLEIMTVILEQYQNEFSVEEKASLKKDIKQIKEKVENMSDKVEAASKKVKGQRKRRLNEH